ncbi:hypothetical protein QBC40DRAFT_67052 [Triangularia verruculosa]|uniref:Uncharacterized protein n=1 Tax=Triangularia verruculosa TaxID=2587418 RepID=A0AAN6XHQ8_9PEZI|nr:hypothetical protein QBC40DRAFT_67052 [Triangularia verruculosa]
MSRLPWDLATSPTLRSTSHGRPISHFRVFFFLHWRPHQSELPVLECFPWFQFSGMPPTYPCERFQSIVAERQTPAGIGQATGLLASSLFQKRYPGQCFNIAPWVVLGMVWASDIRLFGTWFFSFRLDFGLTKVEQGNPREFTPQGPRRVRTHPQGSFQSKPHSDFEGISRRHCSASPAPSSQHTRSEPVASIQASRVADSLQYWRIYVGYSTYRILGFYLRLMAWMKEAGQRDSQLNSTFHHAPGSCQTSVVLPIRSTQVISPCLVTCC